MSKIYMQFASFYLYWLYLSNILYYLCCVIWTLDKDYITLPGHSQRNSTTMACNPLVTRGKWPLEGGRWTVCAEQRLAPYLSQRLFFLVCLITISISFVAILVCVTACLKHLKNYFCRLLVMDFTYVVAWPDIASKLFC